MVKKIIIVTWIEISCNFFSQIHTNLFCQKARKRFFLSYEKWNGKIFAISKWQFFFHFKWQNFFPFQMAKNIFSFPYIFLYCSLNLFSWPECISFIHEPNWTSFLLDLCKILEIFENWKNIFAIWNGKIFCCLK